MYQDVFLWLDQVKPQQQSKLSHPVRLLAKACSLRLAIPTSLILTSKFFTHLTKANPQITPFLHSNPHTPAKASSKLIDSIQLPPQLQLLLQSHLTQLASTSHDQIILLVSVDSQTTPTHSFYHSKIISPQSSQALPQLLSSYLSLQHTPHTLASFTVLIQPLPNPDSSGIARIGDPSNQDQIIIESIFGLNLPLTHGTLTPDRFQLDLDANIMTQTIATKLHQLIATNSKLRQTSLPQSQQQQPSITPPHLTNLAHLAIQIHQKLKTPLDIHWSLIGSHLSINFVRPVTHAQAENISNLSDLKPILTGLPVSPGTIVGTVRALSQSHKITKTKPGEIIVTNSISLQDVPYLEKASGIITQTGGLTSTAAIVARELKIPCLVAAEQALHYLKSGQLITLDANHGLVYQDKQPLTHTTRQTQTPPSFKTKTKVYSTLKTPEIATAVSALPIDGIMPLDGNIIITQYLAAHPAHIAAQKKSHYATQKISEILKRVAHQAGGRPVLYQFSNLLSSQYHLLTGGAKYETSDINPLMGLHGTARHLHQPKNFLLELNAFKKARQHHLNLHLVIPFVRSTLEFTSIKKLMFHHGLKRTPNLKFYLSLDLPANIICLPEYIQAGLDGLIINLDSLLTHTLAIDPANPDLNTPDLLNDSAFTNLLRQSITLAKKHKLFTIATSSHLGQDPELVQKLIKWGIQAVTVSPTHIHQVRQNIRKNEINLSKNKHRQSPKL